MFYTKFEDIDGDFVNPQGVRFHVSAVRRVRNSLGVNIGYVEFASLKEALDYWELSRIENGSSLAKPED